MQERDASQSTRRRFGKNRARVQPTPRPRRPLPGEQAERAVAALAELTPDADGVFLISAIERQERRKRFNLFVNGQFALALDPEVLGDSALRTGDAVQPEQLQELAARELRKRALDGALHSLAARPRSESELRQRLTRRALPADVIDHTIGRLREFGYVNDEDFARQWVESRSGSNPRGRRVVAQELRMKGVDPATAEAALEALPEADSARRVAEKRVRGLHGLAYPEFRTRLSDHLVRRGFGYDVVKEVVTELWQREGGAGDEDAVWEE